MRTKVFFSLVILGLLGTWKADAQWTAVGTGVYHENLIPDYDETYARGQKWNVTIEESSETPGLYRFIPYHETSGVASWIAEADNTYMIIHAENPDKVWMEDFKPYPAYELFWFTHMVPESGWTGEAAGYGKLKDGKISFPANSHAFINIYDEDQRWFVTNTTGEFGIELPRGDVVKDYNLFLKNPYCAADNKVPVTVNAGLATAAVRYQLFKGAKKADEALAQEIAENGSVAASAEFTVECPENGLYTLVVVATDEVGKAQTFKTTELYGVYDNSSEWKSLGTGTYHEAVIAEHYGYDPVDLSVEVQENVAVPGYYRLVNPYSGYEGNIRTGDSHNHYMYIHAENPEAVWVENSPIGADFGYGDGRVTSAIAKAVEEGFTVAEAISSDVERGVVKGNVISFPEWGLYYADRDYFEGMWYSSGLGFSVTLPEREQERPVDLSAKGTANCYIVAPGSEASFDARFKGNSSTESIGPATACKLVWQTEKSLISGLAYADGRISFTAADKPGNALVAALDAEGDILWSWHLWVVDYDASNEFTTPENANGTTWTFMDRNLGAVNTGHGDTGSYGMIYQWGRKDPFPGAVSHTVINEDYSYQTDGEPELYDIDNNVLPKIRELARYHGTLDLSVKNPMVFYALTKYNTGEKDEYGQDIVVDDPRTGDWTDVSDDNAWGGESFAKTIYDPSPVGYKVPVCDAKGATPYAWLTYAQMTWDTEGEGAEQDGQWFPATGTRVYASGGLDFTAAAPYSGLWIGTKGKASSNLEEYPTLYGQYMMIVNGRRTFKVGKDRRSQGLSLRCVRDNGNPSGIENVVPDRNTTFPATVYNLQGVPVKTVGNMDETRTLPAGIYIVASRKYIVR